MRMALNAIKTVIHQHKTNIALIWFVAKSHFKKQTISTTLGIGWVIIHDVIYFTVFTFFRIMMSGNRELNGMNIIMYLLSGIAPWFFMNDVLNSGTRCLTINKNIYSNMSFPTSIIPTFETLSIFLKRIISFSLLFILTAVFHYYQYVNPILLIYYFFSMVVLTMFLNMVISPLIAISKDLDQMYRAILKILFFLVPILWSFDFLEEINPLIIILLKSNPLVYIIEGFRDAFYYGDMPNLLYTIYFWVTTLLLFVIGCILQIKIEKYYDDWI